MRGKARLPEHGRATVGCRLDAVIPDDRFDRVTADVAAKRLEPAADARVAPSRVLPCQADNREQLQKIDLRVARPHTRGRLSIARERVEIRIIQLLLGHASIQQTQRYLNVTDEELRRGLE